MKRGRPKITDAQSRLGVIHALATSYPRGVNQSFIYDFLRNAPEIKIKDRKGIRRCLKCLKEDGIISEVKPYVWRMNDTDEAFAKVAWETGGYVDGPTLVEELKKRKSELLVRSMGFQGRKYFRKMGRSIYSKQTPEYERVRGKWKLMLSSKTDELPTYKRMGRGATKDEILRLVRPRGITQPEIYKLIKKKIGIRSDRWIRQKLKELEDAGHIVRISGKKEGKPTVWKLKEFGPR